jgi:hypothetical protein
MALVSIISTCQVKVKIRPTICRPVCLGVKHQFGTKTRFFFCLIVAGLLIWGTFSEERKGLSFTMYNIFIFYMSLHECIYTIYTRLLSVQTLSIWGQSQSYDTTDGQWASLFWNKAPIWSLRPDLYYCLAVASLLMCGALSDERTGLSFARVTVSSSKSVVSMYNLHFTCY